MSASKMFIKKPCCKVCQDAGKPEEVYTSHWVKDLTGKTICPTLLNVECRFCHKPGHTTKYCKELEQMNRERARVEKQLSAVAKKKMVSAANPTKKNDNKFAVFCDDDQSSDSDQEEVAEVVPQVLENKWASIAAKPKSVVTQKPSLLIVSDCPRPVEPKLAPWASASSVSKKRWADESDSEDDDDELPEVHFSDEVEDDSW